MNAVDPLLKSSEVTALLQISYASLNRRVKDGTLPAPIKLGAASRWSRAEILAAIDARKAVQQ